jgi:hypothetical protein
MVHLFPPWSCHWFKQFPHHPKNKIDNCPARKPRKKPGLNPPGNRRWLEMTNPNPVQQEMSWRIVHGHQVMLMNPPRPGLAGTIRLAQNL